MDELRGNAQRRKDTLPVKKDAKTENPVLKKKAMRIDPKWFIDANAFTEPVDLCRSTKKKSEKKYLFSKKKSEVEEEVSQLPKSFLS